MTSLESNKNIEMMKTKLKMNWTKTSISLALIFLFIGQINAQVGFDNPNPDPSAVVDIASTSKGLLIPRLTSSQRAAMAIGTPTPAEGLLVFDTDVNRLFYWDDAVSAWRPVNFADVRDHSGNEIAHIKTELTVGAGYVSNTAPDNGLVVEGQVGIGTSSPASGQKLDVVGDAQVSGTISANKIDVTDEVGSGIVPSGAILMWNGNTVPSGWALCDGNNGTPDLRDRFVVSTGSAYSVGNTGGHDFVTLTQAETPLKDHTHYVDIETTTDGIHNHRVGYDDSNGGSGAKAHESADNSGCNGCGDYTTHSAGNHTHNVQGNTNNSGTGSASPHENRPRYYALAFIMKL